MTRLILAAAAAIALATPAYAQVFEVIHPEIKKGGFEFEALNGWSLANVDNGDERSAHEFAISYAPTNFWKPILAIEIANPEGASAEYEGFEWENVFLFTGGHHHGHNHDHDHGHAAEFAIGAFAALAVPNAGGIGSGKFEFGPIAEVSFGPASVIGNFIVEVPFEDGEDVGYAYGLSAAAKVGGPFSVGIEAFGEVEGGFVDAPALDQQEHFIGPAVYSAFDIGKGRTIEPRLAFLFGLTDAASDAVLSFNLELKF